jgi:hypothetical protein
MQGVDPLLALQKKKKGTSKKRRLCISSKLSEDQHYNNY